MADLRTNRPVTIHAGRTSPTKQTGTVIDQAEGLCCSTCVQVARKESSSLNHQVPELISGDGKASMLRVRITLHHSADTLDKPGVESGSTNRSGISPGFYLQRLNSGIKWKPELSRDLPDFPPDCAVWRAFPEFA